VGDNGTNGIVAGVAKEVISIVALVVVVAIVVVVAVEFVVVDAVAE